MAVAKQSRSARSSRLSPAAVVDRAMALADAEGLSAVTLRRLADLLDVTPMALYWHFRDKDALLGALADRVLAEVDLTVDERAEWPDQLSGVMTSMLGVFRNRPWATGLLAGRDAPSPSELRALEVMLGILARSGMTPAQAVGVTRQLVRTVIGLVSDEPLPDAGDVAGATAPFDGLPADRFPHVLAAAEPLTRCDDADDYYAVGMELLFRGIRGIPGAKPQS